MAKRFTEAEQHSMLKHIKVNKNLVFAPTTKSNIEEKNKVWEQITEDVNSVSFCKRDGHKVAKRFSDWKYSVTKNKKKKLTGTDMELLTLLQELNEDTGEKTEPNDIEKDADEGDVLHERFDEEETASFVRLVCSQYNVLFGSFSNHVTNELKTKTWDDICSQINEVFARNRTVISLKCKWQRLVIGVKAKCVDINKANRTTGLHDYKVPQLTATEEDIKNAISI